ncbi:hypothetical protein AVM02_01310 [Brucella anthropi]|uniref:hypothetical protein n=1 Tax=Brucella anthropi TaxID=529 RepID=UPI003985B146
MSEAAPSGERKSFWLCLVLLVITLPIAAFVGSDGALLRWIEQKLQEPVVVPRGNVQAFGGGEWKLVALDRFPGTLPETNIVLAEVEVTIQDADQLKRLLPCFMTATDTEGRRWSPLYVSAQTIGKLKPEAADKPKCYDLSNENGSGPVRLVESFLVPAKAGELSLLLTMLGKRPEHLVLK